MIDYPATIISVLLVLVLTTMSAISLPPELVTEVIDYVLSKFFWDYFMEQPTPEHDDFRTLLHLNQSFRIQTLRRACRMFGIVQSEDAS